MVRNDGKSTRAPTAGQFCDEQDLSLLSPEKVATYLGLSADELATAAQIDSSAIRHHSSSPEIQPLLKNIVWILLLAGEIFQSSDSAAGWFMCERVPAFHDETAFALIVQGRTEDVIQYLHSIESGFVG